MKPIIKICLPVYCDCNNVASAAIHAALGPWCKGRGFGLEGLNRPVMVYDTPFAVFHVQNGSGSFLPDLRASLVAVNERRRQSLPYTGYLFIDADNRPVLQDFEDIISSGYPIYHFPYEAHGPGKVFACANAKLGFPGVPDFRFPLDSKGIEEVDLVPMGFTYIEARVFEAIDFPWFQPYIYDVGGAMKRCSEDYGLCVAAREAGFRPMVNFNRPVYHKPRSRKMSENKAPEQKKLPTPAEVGNALRKLGQEMSSIGDLYESIYTTAGEMQKKLQSTEAEIAELKKKTPTPALPVNG